jgi:hypothetical protein
MPKVGLCVTTEEDLGTDGLPVEGGGAPPSMSESDAALLATTSHPNS